MTQLDLFPFEPGARVALVGGYLGTGIHLSHGAPGVVVVRGERPWAHRYLVEFEAGAAWLPAAWLRRI